MALSISLVCSAARLNFSYGEDAPPPPPDAVMLAKLNSQGTKKRKAPAKPRAPVTTPPAASGEPSEAADVITTPPAAARTSEPSQANKTRLVLGTKVLEKGRGDGNPS